MNGVMQCRIVVLLNGVRAAMYSANFTDEGRKKLWAETISNTENVRNNSIAASRGVKSANDFFWVGDYPF